MSEIAINPNQLVYLQDICSMEYYDFGEDGKKQVFCDINMEGLRGESWALLGDVAFELRLLMEIIANTRRYEKGKCVLAQIGMMRKKKLILPHVFYIGSTNMLFDQLSVLDYLKMINAKEKKNVFLLEKELLQDLIDVGLGYLSLTQINYLSAQEKAIFTLFTALYYDSDIVIMNLARLPFSDIEIKCVQTISNKLREKDKLFLFSTMYPEVAQAWATHLLALYDGHEVYHGEINSFIEQYDYQILHLEDPDIVSIHAMLFEKVKKCEFQVQEQMLDIFCLDHPDRYIKRVFRLLQQSKMVPRVMIQSEPSLANAWKERKKVYDQ